MIISASRRTDIPAYFPGRFYEDLKLGYTHVENPYNKKISTVDLRKDAVDVIVFWTKNAGPIIPYLKIIGDMGYPYIFHYTVNNYPEYIEKHTPELIKTLETIDKLASTTGNDRIIWRYDPIFVTDRLDFDFHLGNFKKIAQGIHGAVKHVKISFYDEYVKTKRRIFKEREGTVKVCGYPFENVPGNLKLLDFLYEIKSISDHFDMKISSCSEKHRYELNEAGIHPGACIDKNHIEEVFGIKIGAKKDKGQRELCNCVRSTDIGRYNTCKNGCIYCYASS